MTNERDQAVLINGRAAIHTVRNIQEWDGRVVGIVRHGGGEWVVQRRGDGWDALESVSKADLSVQSKA